MPVYFAIDVSASMAGAAIEALNLQLREMVLMLQEDPIVAESTWLSVIAFSDGAQVVLPLSPVFEASALPALRVGGPTAYGPALRLLGQRIEQDAHRLRDQGVRPRRPIVFFITDGAPTDMSWERDLALLTSEDNPWRPQIIAIGIGSADPDVLSRVGTAAALVAVEKTSPVEALRTLATAMTASVESAERQTLTFTVPSGFVAFQRPL